MRPALRRLLAPVLAASTAIAAPAPAAPAAACAPAPAQSVAEGIAARAGDLELGFDELDEVLLWRHALAPEGREALLELLNLRLLARLAQEQKLEVSQRQLNERWKELDERTKAEGQGGLRSYLASQDIDPEVFREYLRLSIVHEILARRGLGIPEKAPITAEQQNAWLQGVIEERGFREEPHPWKKGLVARCGDLVLSRQEYLDQLRRSLEDEELERACYEALLEERARARMPDLAAEAIEAAVEEEVERRRAEAEADPRFQGIEYESLLQARGLSVESVRRDPAVRAAALGRVWVERTHDEASVRALYEAERALFDGRYGAGVEAAVLLLKAAQRKNELNPRSFEEAEAELERLRASIGGWEDFVRLAAQHSEDPRSRENGGRLGVVRRASEGLPEGLREAIFRQLEAREGEVRGQVLGPLRVQGAAVLLCLGERHPSPTWETMAGHVRDELWRRFLAETLPPAQVRTWIDVEDSEGGR